MLLGKTHAEAGLPDEIAQRFDDSLERIFSTGYAEAMDFDFSGPGGLRHYTAFGIPVGPYGEIESVLTVTRDVTSERGATGGPARRQRRAAARQRRSRTVRATRQATICRSRCG